MTTFPVVRHALAAAVTALSVGLPTAWGVPDAPTVVAVRTGPSALKDQRVQPVAASSE